MYSTEKNPLKICVIERSISNMIGGTCVNLGCVPKKVTWSLAGLYHNIHEYASTYGIYSGHAPLETDHTPLKPLLVYSVFKERRDAYIERLRGIYTRNLLNTGITLIEGNSTIIDYDEDIKKVVVKVGDSYYSGKHVLIAAGGEPLMPEIKGVEHVINSDGFFALNELPTSVVILGAGYIAIELACLMNELGVLTTLCIRRDSFLRSFDHEIAKELERQMVERGIVIKTGFVPLEVLDTEAEKLPIPTQGKTCDRYKVLAENGDSVYTDLVISAIGRTCRNSIRSILDSSCYGRGLEMTSCDQLRHFRLIEGQNNNTQHIWIDKKFQTTFPGVYAVGDITGKAELTPVAIAQGRRLADHLFGNNEISTELTSDVILMDERDYKGVPTVIFSHPPMATVGLSEENAVSIYGKDNLKIFSSKFNNLFYGIFDEEFKRPKTMCKIICKKEDHLVVGVHMIGDAADEVIQGFCVAVKMGCTKEDLDNTLAIHPTAGEELVTMAPWSKGPGEC